MLHLNSESDVNFQLQSQPPDITTQEGFYTDFYAIYWDELKSGCVHCVPMDQCMYAHDQTGFEDFPWIHHTDRLAFSLRCAARTCLQIMPRIMLD